MGSFFLVQASNKRGCRVTLNVQLKPGYDIREPSGVGLCLMLLHDKGPGPLRSEISLDDLMDRAWSSKHAWGYIRDMDFSGEYNTITTPKTAETPPWASPKGYATWLVEVEVSHPLWLEHINDGDAWDSAAFNPTWEYEKGAPIVPQAAQPADPEGMFIWVPRACYSQEGWTKLPRLMEMPVYGVSHYTVGEKIAVEDIQPGDPKWLGRPLWTLSSHDREDTGVIAYMSASGAPVMATMSRSGWGFGGGCKAVGTLIPKQKARPSTKLTYADVLERVKVTVTRVVCEGPRVVLTLTIPPNGRRLRIESATDVLGILIEPSWRSRDSQAYEPMDALMSAITADATERKFDGLGRVKDVLPRLANAYIASYTLQAPEPTSLLPELESLTHAQAKAALEAPWPTATLEVVVRDAAWVEHLGALEAPFAIRDRPLPEPVEDKAPEPPPQPDEHVVLSDGDFVWRIARFGARLWRRWGYHDELLFRRSTSEDTYASSEAAAAQLRADVAERMARDEEPGAPLVRIHCAPELLAQAEERLGVTLARSNPPTVIACVDPAQRFDDSRRFRPDDIIQEVYVTDGGRRYYVDTLEVLVAALQSAEGRISVGYKRPSTRWATSISIA